MSWPAALGLVAFALSSCGSSPKDQQGTGGSSGAGGHIGSGGSGGREGGSGGTGAGGTSTGGSASGGATSATGGASGSVSSGGRPGTGGSATGGATQTGGAPGSGGVAGAGGISSGSGGGAGSGLGGGGGAAPGTGGTGQASCAGTASATPGDQTESIKVGSLTRTFIRHIPRGYIGKTPVPVVIDFHGVGGTGAGQKSATTWGSVADTNGFIMVWPDGVGNSWNVGRCCSTAQSENVDDVAFTRAIIATLQKEACIDPKRIYASGCSNGGGLAFKVACDAADVIAAVAPVDFDCVTGAAANPSCGSCMPARPISEIQFRGTNDTAVPYGGGSGPRGTVFPGAEENFMEWGAINKCTGAPQPAADEPACQAYPMCASGVQTILCTVKNGTHCGSYQAFKIVDLAWSMFQKEALP